MKQFRKALLLATLSLSAVCHAQQQIAIFSINDFHGAFVRNDEKGIVGARVANTRLTQNRLSLQHHSFGWRQFWW